MRLVRTLPSPAQAQLQMTSMIDIVFLLLVFFVMTFKVITPEGDFQLHMAAEAPGPPRDEAPPEKIRVRLRAGEDGSLASIEAERQPLASLDELRALVMGLTVGHAGPASAALAPEIEFDADPDLEYRHLMAALTAVKGHLGPQGEVIDLVEKIKLLPQRGAL